ncbi:MAG: sugar transferase [Hyphomonadaceae bacterium]
MRDQASATGAEARLRVIPELSRTRATALSGAQSVADEAATTATVIAPHPMFWKRRRFKDGEPVGGWAKRLFDVVAAGAAIIMLAPLLALIWLAVRIERKGGDAIFKQERGGFGGRAFTIYKFRTMTCAESGRHMRQVKSDDDRVTRLGGFLRRTSWDELPQLFNVLAGDMSLIGPRPHALQHDSEFADVDPSYTVRFRARPGITGLAQVSGCRGPTETPDKVRERTAYDVQYVQEWSPAEDFKVLWLTLMLFAKRDPRAI